MRKIFSLFLMTFVCGIISQAQIKEFGIGSGVNSIVREIGGDTMLIYTEISPTESYFLLYNEADVFAKAFLPAPILSPSAPTTAPPTRNSSSPDSSRSRTEMPIFKINA